MAKKQFPGLQPYIAAATGGRGVSDEFLSRVTGSWAVRAVNESIAALSSMDAIPGDMTASKQESMDRVVALVDAMKSAVEGMLIAAVEQAEEHGLDASKLSEIVPDEFRSDLKAAVLNFEARARQADQVSKQADARAIAAERRAAGSEANHAKLRETVAGLTYQLTSVRNAAHAAEAEYERKLAGFKQALVDAGRGLPDETAGIVEAAKSEVVAAKAEAAKAGAELAAMKADAEAREKAKQDAAIREKELAEASAKAKADAEKAKVEPVAPKAEPKK